MFGLGWLALDLAFWRLVRASPAKDRVHATLVGLALLAGASGPLSYAAFGNDAYPWLVLAGLWLFAVPVFVVVCHRMIPFFTANVLPTVAVVPAVVAARRARGRAFAARRPWPGSAFRGGRGSSTCRGAAGASTSRGAGDSSRAWPTGSSRCCTWASSGTRSRFLLEGAASLAVLAGGPPLGVAGTHALGMGFCGSLMIAMVSRVTLGHSGRTLAADRVTWGLFLLLQVAVVVRIGSALWPHPGVLALAALLWTACGLPWALRYLPIYGRPRADGKPG